MHVASPGKQQQQKNLLSSFCLFQGGSFLCVFSPSKKKKNESRHILQ